MTKNQRPIGQKNARIFRFPSVFPTNGSENGSPTRAEAGLGRTVLKPYSAHAREKIAQRRKRIPNHEK
jgi:hypothetical protein